MESDYAKKITRIIRENQWLMQILNTVQKVGLPDWYVAAGAVRSVIWDYFHGFEKPTPVNDVDVIFYDPYDLSHETEKRIEQELQLQMEDTKWDVKNQAAIHLWYRDVFGYTIPPRTSSIDAIATWSPSSIGARLSNGEIEIAAPNGLDDLCELKFRGNPAYIPNDLFMARVKKRRIQEKWPLVQIIEEQ